MDDYQESDESLPNFVADELRSLIVRGTILPGEHLGQTQLAKRFGRSKVPIREALKLLSTEGFLRHDRNRGYFVAPLEYAEAVQLYKLRRWLEIELLETAEWRVAHMADAVHGDFSTATDLADFLAASGLPFRQAHEIVGKVVRACQARDMVLEDLTESTLKEIAPEVPAAALDVLSPEGSVKRRESLGGPGPKAMAAQLAHARDLLGTTGFPRVA